MFLPVILETLCGVTAAPIAGVGLLAAGAVAGIAHCCSGSSSGSSGSYSNSYDSYSNGPTVTVDPPRKVTDRELRELVRYVGGGVIIG